jgi:hypothetical protein
MTRYNTNLAAEFYVLSMLHRLGADAALTLGNKKAVDIIVANDDGTTTTIDVKGVRKRFDWPASNIHLVEGRRHFYVLVSFEGKMRDPLTPPAIWIVPAQEIGEFIVQYGTRPVVSRKLVNEKGRKFFQAWSLIVGEEF